MLFDLHLNIFVKICCRAHIASNTKRHPREPNAKRRLHALRAFMLYAQGTLNRGLTLNQSVDISTTLPMRKSGKPTAKSGFALRAVYTHRLGSTVFNCNNKRFVSRHHYCEAVQLGDVRTSYTTQIPIHVQRAHEARLAPNPAQFAFLFHQKRMSTVVAGPQSAHADPISHASTPALIKSIGKSYNHRMRPAASLARFVGP